MNYQSKNVCVLANYIDPKRKYYRHVYCIEYKTKQLFKLTVPGNVNPECFAAQSLPINIPEFSDIEKGDIITSIDGKVLNNMIELREYIYTKSPGDTISINISRGYITKTFDITLK